MKQMLVLHGGPAEGSYLVSSGPFYLRAVVDNNGKKDILNDPDDKPSDREKIFVYHFEQSGNIFHLNSKSFKGFVNPSHYLYLPDVDGEEFRDNEKWRAWATARGKHHFSGEHPVWLSCDKCSKMAKRGYENKIGFCRGYTLNPNRSNIDAQKTI